MAEALPLWWPSFVGVVETIIAAARHQAFEEAAVIAEERGEQYREPTQGDYDARMGCYDAAAAIRAKNKREDSDG